MSGSGANPGALLLAGEAVAVARQTIGAHSKSFALASRLLPVRLRDEAAVLYTWCRRADDAIDLEPSLPAQAQALARLHEELDLVYDGDVAELDGRDPALAAFARVIRAHGIPRAYPEDLLAGLAMDAAGTRYRNLDQLLRYCYRVAGTVGLMMAHVIGVRSRAALRHAAHLGLAMQLTNICRDVVEDWGRGRLYLPAELLARHGGRWLVGRELAGEASPPEAARAPMAAAAAELCVLAERLYRSGDRGLRALPWRAGLGVRAARLVYSAIGGEIAGRDHDVLLGRAVVPRWRKLALAAWALVGQLPLLPHALCRPFRAAPLAAAPPTRFPDDILPL